MPVKLKRRVGGAELTRSRSGWIWEVPPRQTSEGVVHRQPIRRGRLPWAQLLRRVFSLDALRCPRCARPMVVPALISDLAVVARILTHLGLPAEPPALAPAGERAGDAADLDEFFVDLDEPVGEVFEEPPGEPSSSDAPWGDDEAPP